MVSRRDAPEVLQIFAPPENRGRREDRVRAAPAISCAMCTKRCAHEHTGSAETLRPSLRNGFTAYNALSSATNSSCHRRQRIEADRTRLGRLRLRWLDISNGCQNHTPSPYASAPSVCAPVNHSRETRPAIPFRADAAASTASQPAFVTIAIRPSYRVRRAELCL